MPWSEDKQEQKEKEELIQLLLKVKLILAKEEYQLEQMRGALLRSFKSQCIIRYAIFFLYVLETSNTLQLGVVSEPKSGDMPC